jgi:hypothetical protein
MSTTKPKVFIATGRSDWNKLVEPLNESFSFTTDTTTGRQTAEFCLVDLGVLPKDPEQYVEVRANLSPAYIAHPRFPAPCLFVTFGDSIQTRAEELVETARGRLDAEPMVAKSVEELERHLKWLWRMFPYKQLTEELQAEMYTLTLNKDLQERLQKYTWHSAITAQRTGGLQHDRG